MSNTTYWVETVGSPRISGDRVERIYHAYAGHGIELLNSYNDERHYSDGYYRKDQSSVQCGVFDTVTLVFTRTLEGSVSTDTRTTYDIENSPTARDIRLLSNYRTCWRYNLYGFKPNEGAVPAVPAWWATATDLNIASELLGTYAWGESTPASDASGVWALLKTRTVNADTYPYPAPTVTETVYVRSEGSAGSRVQRVGTCRAPGKTFGYSADSRYWQVTSCSTSKQGGKWLVRTTYQYAPAGWDGRIIPGGFPEGGDL